MKIWSAMTTGRRMTTTPNILSFRTLATNLSYIFQHGFTSHVAWKNLEAIYEDKSQETAIMIIQNLWHTTAKEGDDISEHLTTLKKYWEHLNLVNDNSFKILEVQFKITIISSLPMSWDTFTQPYASIGKGDYTDLKLHITSQELIGGTQGGIHLTPATIREPEDNCKNLQAAIHNFYNIYPNAPWRIAQMQHKNLKF